MASTACNRRFCKIAALPRVDNICVFLRRLLALRMCWKPLPRQAAGTLAASFGDGALKNIDDFKIMNMYKIVKISILCVLLGIVQSKSFAIIPNRIYRFYPEKMGLIYKDLDVKTPDGLMIKTWFFPAQLTPSDKELETAWENPVKKPYRTIDNKRRPTIIICTGDAGNMSWDQLHYAQYFTDKGYNVVTFDWRGFGESSEWNMNHDYLVYSELLIDYDAVIRKVLQQREVDTSAIAVFGWSTGAYLSMAAASKYSNIKAFVAIGLMTTFEEVYPVLKKVSHNINRNLIIPDDYPMELQPLKLAPTWDKATFLIVGELDDRAPVWMSQKIYEILRCKKELWIVNEAEHGGPKGPAKDFALLNKRIIEFLDNNLDSKYKKKIPKTVSEIDKKKGENILLYLLLGLLVLLNGWFIWKFLIKKKKTFRLQ